MTIDKKFKQCERCGGTNPKWKAPNHIWRRYAFEYNILCPTCFIMTVNDRGGEFNEWKIKPIVRDCVSKA